MNPQGSSLRTSLLGLILALGTIGFAAAQRPPLLTVDKVMTPQEMRDTGIFALSPIQKQAFNEWLNRYSVKVFRVGSQEQTTDSSARSSCSPAVESNISGEIEGWDGDTIFKLDNGQIWQQAGYDYTYFYAYHPDVTIYPTTAGCRMKVEDETGTVLVKRIK
jgi:hypothetical protein